eukprot:g47357.t1
MWKQKHIHRVDCVEISQLGISYVKQENACPSELCREKRPLCISYVKKTHPPSRACRDTPIVHRLCETKKNTSTKWIADTPIVHQLCGKKNKSTKDKRQWENASKIGWLAFHWGNALVLVALCCKQWLRLRRLAPRRAANITEDPPPAVIVGYSSTAVLNTDRPRTVACLALLRAMLWTIFFWLPWARGRQPAVGWALSEAAVFSVVLLLFARAYDPGRDLLECACALALLVAYTVMTVAAVKSVVAGWLVVPLALALGAAAAVAQVRHPRAAAVRAARAGRRPAQARAGGLFAHLAVVRGGRRGRRRSRRGAGAGSRAGLRTSAVAAVCAAGPVQPAQELPTPGDIVRENTGGHAVHGGAPRSLTL